MKVTAKLATAFALGAAISAALLTVLPTSRVPLIRESGSDKPANTDDPNLERKQPLSGSALEPLDKIVLVERSVEAFPAGYLLLISIIQSVALGLLLTQAVPIIFGSATAIGAIAAASKTVTLFGFLVIISYEYLWFIGMMRWTSTFRDALIPYAIGVAEIIPCLTLDRSLSWWIATTMIPIISGGALFNTISRLDLRAFAGESAVSVYRTLRLLTWRTIMCCGIIVTIGSIGSVLVALGALHGIALSVAPIALVLPGLIAVGFSEKSLNYVYDAYGISRRPVFLTRQHRP
jgi:hypothetical protein